MNILFCLMIAFYVADFAWDEFLNYLNRKHMSPTLPGEAEGIYDAAEYARMQNYQHESGRFEFITKTAFFAVVLVFLLCRGPARLDAFVRSYTENYFLLPLIFFWIIIIVSGVLNVPFHAYDTFVIEGKYGFNKTTPRTFVLDFFKSMALVLVLTGLSLGIILAAYRYAGDWFWVAAWVASSIVSLIIAFFYSEWIVPIFNKQTPLEEGELREAIETFARKCDFPIQNIYVIDGSRRSTKSNAYFTGFGKKKRIVLYDTLIDDLNADEIVGVLAHEIGHYKLRHIYFSVAVSLVKSALMLRVFSAALGSAEISYALGGPAGSLNLALLGFGLLWMPASELLNFASTYFTRRHEYQADAFTAKQGMGEEQISALKKISAKSLTNLTPHPFVVFWRRSHPTLLQRIAFIRGEEKAAASAGK